MGKIKKNLATILGLPISVAAIAYLVVKTDFEGAWVLLRQAPFWVVPVLSLIYLAAFPLRALRWKLMLGRYPLSLKEFLNGVVLGFAGNNLLPARGGELIRVRHFHQHTKSGYFTGLFSIFTEKILDGCVLLLFLGAALFFLNQQGELALPWVRKLSFTAIPIFCITLSVLVLVRNLGLFFVKVLRRQEVKVFTWLASLLLKLQRAIQFLKLNFGLIAIILLSLGIWLLEGSMFMIAIQVFLPGVDVFWLGLFVLAVVNFGLLVPSSPGYLGVFQGMTLLALSVVKVEQEPALAVSLLVHLFQFLPITLWGIVVGWKQRNQLFGLHAEKPLKESPLRQKVAKGRIS